MSKTLSIHRKLTDFHNKENINNSSNLQHKKNINNQKYNKRSTEDLSIQLNTNLANQLLTKINDNNYSNNLFNETENSKIFKQENNSNINTNINMNIPNGIINTNDLINKKINNNPKFISINDIIGEKCELNLEILRLFFNSFDPSKTSRKNMGVVKSYGVNTYQGIVRNYNEDRVSIIINMNKPKDYNKGRWPKISFFGIYDGHGGEGCSEYLRDNLHKLICNNEYFPENVSEAIKLGISKAEQDFLNNYALSQNKEEIIDKSGSCAIIIILVDTNIYISNVGDSRCLLSMNNGNKYVEVTRDHKPNSPDEIIRIKKNGGNIYQSQTVINNTDNVELNGKILIGPYRVLPGRLSVSRTIGDAEAKMVKFGGNPNVIISEPEIFTYDLKNEDIDFFILGCDGIYDQMTNKEVLDCAWMVINEKENILIKECTNIHNQSGLIVDLILKSSLARKSFDNVTCLFIALKDLGMKEIEQNDISNDKINKNFGDTSNDNGITPQKINPITPNDTSQEQNKKNNFEKIYTIKRKANVLSKQLLNDYNNTDDKKCRTNRNDNRYQLLNDNRIVNNNNIFNTDYKLSTLKLNNDIDNKQKELINYQNLSMKDFGANKNNNSNFHKIQAKQNNHKENNDNIINDKPSHSKYQTANLMAYSKKNQSFTKINKYLITLNNNNTHTKPIKKTINFDNYQTYTNKKVSEGNINKKKNSDINNHNNSNNSHIFKPVTKFNLNPRPLKAIELKHSSTSSTKNLHLTNKNTNIFGNINKFNKNEKKVRHGHTKSHRYLVSNKENRNTTYFNNNSTFNINNNKINNTQNEISINDKLKKKFINLNEQYKYQSQIMNNSNINNSNISGISNHNQNQNINFNPRKPKKHLSLNNPANSSMTLNNNYLINKNINNVFTSRMKREITSKIRQISMQKSLPNNNNFRLNHHQVNGMNSKHNLSMQIAQLNNKINNYNYGDKIQKVKTYKYNNINKNYQNSTFNPVIKKNSEYNFARKYNNKYLVTDLGISKKDSIYEDNKKTNLF